MFFKIETSTFTIIFQYYFSDVCTVPSLANGNRSPAEGARVNAKKEVQSFCDQGFDFKYVNNEPPYDIMKCKDIAETHCYREY